MAASLLHLTGKEPAGYYDFSLPRDSFQLDVRQEHPPSPKVDSGPREIVTKIMMQLKLVTGIDSVLFAYSLCATRHFYIYSFMSSYKKVVPDLPQ
jgi:hypothetical protein